LLNDFDLTTLKAVVLTVDSVALSKEEESLFKEYKPSGFILFKRHCVSKTQVKELVASLREIVGYSSLPILIDQEGGDISRLKEPEWKEYPSARAYGNLAEISIDDACNAAYTNYKAMAEELRELGVNVNCAPVLDVPSPKCHKFLSASRTYGDDVETISKLGNSVCKGLLSQGVTPIIKHIPGHGRAESDSHFALPVVDASLDDLKNTDFKTFKTIAQSELGSAVWAMSAHVMYSNIDKENPATFSRKITDEVIRGEMGFEGVLLTDCLSMRSLGGTVKEKIKKSIDAGMDLTMLTNSLLDDGKMTCVSLKDREIALNTVPNISTETAKRIQVAEKQRIAYAVEK